jgi:hypothetical protein
VFRLRDTAPLPALDPPSSRLASSLQEPNAHVEHPVGAVERGRLNPPRVMAFWRSAEERAVFWHRLALFEGLSLVLSLGVAGRVLGRPREVIRIGCDGIPQVVTINDAVYQEPDEREIRAFATSFASFYARSDSYSIVNDFVWCAKRMTPELRERFKTLVRGSGGRPSLVAAIEALKRRTEVEISEVKVDKASYPWRARVRGVQKTVGEGEGGQAFEVDLDLVRTSRDELIEGLLVWGIEARGEALVLGFTRPLR